MRTQLVIFLLLLSLMITSCLVPEQIDIPGEAEKIKVSFVYDGDTFRDTRGRVYRVVGIDTPELHSSTKPRGEFAEAAKDYATDYLFSHDVYVLERGKDVYGRTLVYVFGEDHGGNTSFFEEEITIMGLARPLIYEDSDIPEYSKAIVEAYKRAFEDKKGIFSKWYTAPIVRDPSSVETHVGSIVWLEFHVDDVWESKSFYVLDGSWARIIIRKEGFEYSFKDFDPYDFEGKDIEAFGELWLYEGKAEIMLRADFEIHLDENHLEGGDTHEGISQGAFGDSVGIGCSADLVCRGNGWRDR